VTTGPGTSARKLGIELVVAFVVWPVATIVACVQDVSPWLVAAVALVTGTNIGVLVQRANEFIDRTKATLLMQRAQLAACQAERAALRDNQAPKE
jgi:hypothetical protein